MPQFDPRDYIKMNYDDAIILAEQNGYLYNVVETNGVTDVMTFEIGKNIIYFRVSNGIIIGSFMNVI